MTEAQLANEKKSKKSKTDVQRAEFQEWVIKRQDEWKGNVADLPTPVQAMHALRVS